MYNNVYVLFNHNTKVCLGFDRLLEFRTVRQRTRYPSWSRPIHQPDHNEETVLQCFRYRRTSHMCHMHGSCNFTVDSTWCEFRSRIHQIFLCILQAFCQGISDIRMVYHIPSEPDLRHFMSQIVDVFTLGLNAPLFLQYGSASQDLSP